MIKNSKPPIWRRCLIPSGITFEELGELLNIVMGWSGNSENEFEFYYRKLYLSDTEQEGRKGEFLKKKDVVIDSYMEEEEWFTYTYGVENGYQHRVTIEEVVETEQAPAVIKFKGNCPAEEGNEREYQMEAVNEQLKEISLKEKAEKILEEEEKEVGLEGQFHLVMEQLFTQMAKAENGELNQEFLRKNAKNAAQMAQRTVKKIYPNDPCSCGSGKKYKYCCKGR